MTQEIISLRDSLIRPVHAGLQAEFGVPATPEAEGLSIAIKVQESGMTASVRDQGDPTVLGPATGMWQFERMGGVWEILNDGKTKPIALDLCQRIGVDPQPDPVWRIFATSAGDELACAFARLLIWKDPSNPPALTAENEQAAYDYYKRRWRPGAERRTAWTRSWATALQVCAVPGAPAAPLPPVMTQPGADRIGLESRVRALEDTMARIRAAIVVSPD